MRFFRFGKDTVKDRNPTDMENIIKMATKKYTVFLFKHEFRSLVININEAAPSSISILSFFPSSLKIEPASH
jgi:hypothetical protein